MTKLIVADIVTAFSTNTIGTKVTDADHFLEAAIAVIEKHDFANERVPGQAFIMCPAAISYVSAGVGKRTKNPEDFVLRLYRGNVEPYLRREKAAEVEGCAIVVYTKYAYLADPDVSASQTEFDRVKASDATHVLIAVLAFAGPKAPPLALPPHSQLGGWEQRGPGLER